MTGQEFKMLWKRLVESTPNAPALTEQHRQRYFDELRHFSREAMDEAVTMVLRQDTFARFPSIAALYQAAAAARRKEVAAFIRRPRHHATNSETAEVKRIEPEKLRALLRGLAAKMRWPDRQGEKR